MQNIGQNGPEAEVNPLIDNGFMYTSDGWGGIYKIDARQPNQGIFAWYNDLGVRREGNRPQTRGIALWEDLVIANTPTAAWVALNRDSGEVVWDKRMATTNEFGTKERFNSAPLTVEGKVLSQTGSARVRRGWLAALDARTGNELWRWYAVPAPASPAARPGRTRPAPGRPAAAACGRPAPTIRRRGSRSGAPATRRRTTTRWRVRATISTPTPWLRSTSIPASSPGISNIRRTIPGTTTRSASHPPRRHHQWRDAQGGQPFRAQMVFYYTLDRNNGSFIAGSQYVNDLNWTKGLDLKTGKPVEYNPGLDVQRYVRRRAAAAQRSHEAHVPDLARRRRLPADRL